jgi:hypothetical protein
MAKNDYFSTISDKIIAESSGSKNWGIVLSAIFKFVFAIMSTIVSTSLCPNKVS